MLKTVYNLLVLSGSGSISGSSGLDVALTTHPPSSAEVKDRVQLYLYSPSLPSWQVMP